MAYYLCSVAYGNPYRDPPPPLPHTLISLGPFTGSIADFTSTRTYKKLTKIISGLYRKGIYSYNITYIFLDNPKRKSWQWTDEAIKRNRRRKLEQRLRKKYSIPLLLEQAVASAIAAKPDYYT